MAEEKGYTMMAHKRGAAIYVRVSTDKQTVENQVRELRQIAERRGWEVVEQYSDAGISGSKGRDGRPGLDLMLNDAKRRKFDVVMAWAIGAFAEFERGMIRQRIHAGLKRAVEAGKTLGRPRISAAVEKRIQDRLRAGMGIIKVAREVGVGNGTVQRIADEMHRPFVAA